MSQFGIDFQQELTTNPNLAPNQLDVRVAAGGFEFPEDITTFSDFHLPYSVSCSK